MASYFDSFIPKRIIISGGVSKTAKTIVYVLKTKPETVLDDYRRLLEMAGFEKHLPKDHSTIIKDNISWQMPCLGANTTPWQLEGVINTLRSHGYQDLTCVENRTVVTDPFRGARLNKYGPVLRDYQVPLLYNFQPEDMGWIPYRPKAKMLILDQIFKKGIFLPDYFFNKNIIHLPTMKCHIYTTTTGAMKNAFGGLLDTDRHYAHSHIHEALVDLLAIQKEIHSGLFAVMDGTVAGNGPGPRTLRPVAKDYILASDDQVAVDAIAAKMMGFDPYAEIKYIRLAHDRGLGIGKPAEIEVVGADISRENWGFQVGNNLASRAGDLLWFGPLQGVQNFLTHTPLVGLLIFASYLYHDYLWWPALGRPRMTAFKKSSRWGELFDRYPSQ